MSELRIFSFNFAPEGWAFCNGQLLKISDYQVLYGLLGTSYGGDGVTTFGLPNLMGRVAMHVGNNIQAAQMGGEEAHQLAIPEIPNHTHQVSASSSGPDANTPQGNNFASNTGFSPYGAPGTDLMAKDALNPVGGNLPHLNMSPYLTLNICIALTGDVPQRDLQNLFH